MVSGQATILWQPRPLRGNRRPYPVFERVFAIGNTQSLPPFIFAAPVSGTAVAVITFSGAETVYFNITDYIAKGWHPAPAIASSASAASSMLGSAAISAAICRALLR